MTDLVSKFTFFTFTRKHRKQLISESNPVKYISHNLKPINLQKFTICFCKIFVLFCIITCRKWEWL